ncbi:hypothetical protein ONS95_004125 [Cadophora gregata]|uniref:uncharacterized protein n=1 Tax=Cadophora gregata TaxID=51156 RepID=UPI0026DC9FC3|nr:uncharacterized protein ONS95_004125 [Cadophora gregata]KAK0105514.1 hypothetical protein ONS96_004900 [Cadophora gregata f. sp. sojae]KAK0105593.1 hypothetical protein ONS95_004125 [Cadophora gregata]
MRAGGGDGEDKDRDVDVDRYVDEYEYVFEDEGGDGDSEESSPSVFFSRYLMYNKSEKFTNLYFALGFGVNGNWDYVNVYTEGWTAHSKEHR